MTEKTLSDKKEVWEEDEKLRKVVYPEEDLKFHIKRLIGNLDWLGDLNPDYYNKVIQGIKKEFGDDLVK